MSSDESLTPELRRCPISGQGVLIAPGRSIRPMPLAHLPHRPPRHRKLEGTFCPFCPGNELHTPDESFSLRDILNNWKLRAFPNKYPAIDQSGVHEVVVPTCRHDADLSDLSDQELSAMIMAWRDRLVVFSENREIQHATIFMNVGAEAGASIEHIHSQILAVPFIPDAIEKELRGYGEQYNKTNQCFFCNENRNLVIENQAFKAVCPDASRFAYETWIIPTRHNARFEQTSNDECKALASILKQALIAIDHVLHEPAYNLFIHTLPFHSKQPFHWHLELIPRTARAAGFEWGAGVFINTTAPEAASKELANSIKM